MTPLQKGSVWGLAALTGLFGAVAFGVTIASTATAGALTGFLWIGLFILALAVTAGGE